MTYSRMALPLGSQKRMTPVAAELGVEGLGMILFVLEKGQASRIHRHREQEEIYLVLRGRLTLEVEGHEVLLLPNEIVRVSPDARRRIGNRDSETCVFLAIGVVGQHRRGDAEAFLSWDDDVPRSPRDVPTG